MLFFWSYFLFSRKEWVSIALSIADGSNGGVGYEIVMKMDLCEISLIFDTICKRQKEAEQKIKRARR